MNSLTTKLPSIILLLCALSLSGELITEWQYSPYDAGGGIAFILWVAMGWLLQQRVVRPSLLLLGASAMALLTGVITNLDVAIHASILLVALQFVERKPAALVFFGTGVIWTPTFSYMLASLGVDAAYVLTIRMVLVATAFMLVLGVRGMHKSSNQSSINRGAASHG